MTEAKHLENAGDYISKILFTILEQRNRRYQLLCRFILRKLLKFRKKRCTWRNTRANIKFVLSNAPNLDRFHKSVTNK